MNGGCLEKLRCLGVKIAWGCYGVFYRWGGNNPLIGVDCSGFIVWIMRQLGLFRSDEDYTASGLWQLYRSRRVKRPRKGTLVFYGKTKVTHVAICIDEGWCLSASGGNRNIKTLEQAQRAKAFVQLKKIRYRQDIWGYVDPFMEI